MRRKIAYALLILRNQIKRIIYGSSRYHFLFILSPPYCGSTMLSELIGTSKNVSNINPYGNREGKTLPVVQDIMKKANRWGEKSDFPWEVIKNEWLKYWDTTKPLLLEKSPMNIQYGREISSHFSPGYFIVFYRDPYAHVEGLIRRQQLSPKDAALFAVKCLRHQKWNIENLPSVIRLSYEALTNDPVNKVNELTASIPELGAIDPDIKFKAHNSQHQAMKMQNLNESKINKLTEAELFSINEIFSRETDLFDYFGYSLIN